ncbi:MAG: DUF2189 domain-containing protein [Candidatus Accumulibacter sp.]|uniref:DUF2189 domain-containing protein n=3 Tax=Betaproteobacteria incertae sedis TaxID=119066 RepID=A0A080MH36_9PROT|nr:MAG: putative integral membrane protein [Candidatus Accumulibacter cognatus]MBL8402719.1 DUF2189 domain-containing protein [Accumulibacter sp.]TMQ75842.1 putative transmembrane protein [Candidatus Accumulibacter phosphatis]MBN8518274.1 DUF2189 domain-containing protein [Accumulibacter sp.]MBO3709404.1 DUF2189 domain-containing protein [Accumulibacter sp.]
MLKESFPIPAPMFNGASRCVDVGNVFDWFRQGWAIFLANPGVWMTMTVILMVILSGLAIVPWFAEAAACLLTPLLAAGLLLACRKIERDQKLEIRDLFAAFQSHSGGLVVLGVFYMLAMLGAGLLGALPSRILCALIALSIWFASALMVFNRLQPVDALKASIRACLKNFLVFLVYGLISLILCFFAALPIGLGFLVLGPVLAGSVYASYRDIFIAV